MLVICAEYEGNTVQVCSPFPEEEREFYEKLIEIPVVTNFATFQPEEMWIEEVA